MTTQTNSISEAKPVVMVTGSSGLIGTAVSRRLAREFVVVGLDRPGFPHPPEEAEAVDFDLSIDRSVCDAMAQVKRDQGPRVASVIHLAAYYDFSGEPSDLYEKVTVQGTRRLLDALLQNGFTVEQFLFTSTMLVHAPCEPGQRINEDWPIEPKWDYPKSKVRTEQVIREHRRGVPSVIMRVAGVYTDGGDSIPLAQQMARIYENKLTAKVFPGSTSHGQAFVHLDDLVEAIRLAVERRAQLPEETVLLIGEDRTLSYDELQHTFARLIQGESFETTQIPKALAKTGAWFQDKLPGEDPFIKPWMIDLADDHYELNVGRARRLLGWNPIRSLRDTLPKMADALMKDPAEFYRHNELGAPPAEAPAAR